MSRKVLVVDDEPHLLYMLSHVLKHAGYEVVTAPNGQAGYEAACQHLPEAVVTDFQMPIMDGLQMAIQLRANANTSAIPVVMLTARGHKIQPAEMTQTNITDIIAKPLSARELVERLNEIFGVAGLSEAGGPGEGQGHV